MATNRFLSINSSGMDALVTAIASSAGGADANKIIASGADGRLHPSLMPSNLNTNAVYKTSGTLTGTTARTLVARLTIPGIANGNVINFQCVGRLRSGSLSASQSFLLQCQSSSNGIMEWNNSGISSPNLLGTLIAANNTLFGKYVGDNGAGYLNTGLGWYQFSGINFAAGVNLDVFVTLGTTASEYAVEMLRAEVIV